MCKICKTNIKYTDTKKSGSNILYFDINVAFYVGIVFFIFANKYIIKNDVFTVQFTVLKVTKKKRKGTETNACKINKQIKLHIDQLSLPQARWSQS